MLINILSPLKHNESVNNNDLSVSLMVSYGNSKILMTGDLEEKEENNLVDRYGNNLEATILKAGHHGSKSSTGKKLLDTVMPKTVVISVGKNNKYGHPNAATVARIKFSGAETYMTKDMGTIRFKCNLNDCVLKR